MFYIKILKFPELADIPLGELQEIRQKLGTKKFDSMMKRSLQDRETRSFKRANKNRRVYLSDDHCHFRQIPYSCG